MSLKRRIERLEHRQDVEDSRWLTWEEFQHALAALQERVGDGVASELGAPVPTSISLGPRPKNIDSLVRRLKRLLEATVKQKWADESEAARSGHEAVTEALAESG